MKIVISAAALVLFALQSPQALASSRIPVCSGFGCIYKDKLAIEAGDLAYLQNAMRAGQANPAQERETVAQLVGWTERLAQKRLRFMRDTRLSYQIDAGKRGQMDCVDESNNTTALLKFLDRQGLLKFHKPAAVASRGFLLDGRYPHRTAVLRDPRGVKWAIDSWKEHGGGTAQVIDLASWKKERPGDY